MHCLRLPYLEVSPVSGPQNTHLTAQLCCAILSNGMKEILHGFEVETCTELPCKDGEADYDSATYRRFDCKTLDDAQRLARKLLPNDKWGSVAITEFRREPFEPGFPVLHKEYVADTTYVES